MKGVKWDLSRTIFDSVQSLEGLIEDLKQLPDSVLEPLYKASLDELEEKIKTIAFNALGRVPEYEKPEPSLRFGISRKLSVPLPLPKINKRG